MKILCKLLIVSFTLCSNVYSQEAKFINSHLKRALHSADTVKVIDLVNMSALPVIMPNTGSELGKELTKEQVKYLLESLEQSKVIDPQKRVNECSYKPGLKFSFYKDSRETFSFLLCLNCNLWALGSNNFYPTSKLDSIAIFGDSKAFKSELTNFAKELYPSLFEN